MQKVLKIHPMMIEIGNKYKEEQKMNNDQNPLGVLITVLVVIMIIVSIISSIATDISIFQMLDAF